MSAILLVVLGAFTYYVVPSSFLFKRYALFFGVFQAILLLLLLGLTFLAVLFLPFLQRFFAVLFLWIIRKDLRLKPLVVKNLDSHKRRNTKTAIMFTISLSFLIFAGSAMGLLTRLLASQAETALGADLYAFVIWPSASTIIDEGRITQFLK